MASPPVALTRNFDPPSVRQALIAEQSEPRKPKFTAAFLERRMHQHREMMADLQAQLEYDIVREVLTAIERGRR